MSKQKGRRGPTPPKGNRATSRAPTERVGAAFKGLGLVEKEELRRAYKRFAHATAIHAKGHEGFVRTFKAVAHALLYYAQRHAIPSTELVQFLKERTPDYLPHGSQLHMQDELKQKLETGAGFPQWPEAPERAAINRALTDIYHSISTLPVGMQIAVLYSALMRNAERLGMTHGAVLLRLEVLDRLQRHEGPANRYIPDKPPSWTQGRT